MLGCDGVSDDDGSEGNECDARVEDIDSEAAKDRGGNSNVGSVLMVGVVVSLLVEPGVPAGV